MSLSKSMVDLDCSIILLAEAENKKRPILAVIPAAISFVGSAKRIFKIAKTDNALLKWLVLVPIALLLTLAAWVFVTMWYLIFGILVIPYRLIRRSQRKAKRDNLRHRELLQQINKE